jgi:glycerate kinase
MIKIPVADGGESTASAIVAATNGRWLHSAVHDALGRRIKAAFGVTGDGQTAVIETAAASGLVLLKPHERNPLRASTFGAGELIRAALDRGVTKILIGIGGSATNDGGAGMARALGARFFDARGRELAEGGGPLRELARIDMSRLDPRLSRVEILVASDVDNPLFGPRGAARVYAPQKGATPAMVNTLELGLKRLAVVIRNDLGLDIARLPGAGAAGGLGAGLAAFLKGRLRPGVEIVIEAVGLEKKLAGCDLVITGEGRLDAQTVFGKAPAGVAKAAKKFGLPVIAICGSLGPDAGKTKAAGIDACFSALEEPVAEADLRKRAPGMLERCAEQVGRLLSLDAKMVRK